MQAPSNEQWLPANWVLARLSPEQAKALWELTGRTPTATGGDQPPTPAKRQVKNTSGKAARRASNGQRTLRAVGGRVNWVAATYAGDLKTVVRDPATDTTEYTRSPNQSSGRAGKGA